MAKRRRTSAEGEARQAERRRRILDAAALVFARNGFHKTRTREIAAAADVAEGTIYNYFQSKRDILFALVERAMTESVPAVLAQAEGGGPAALLEAITQDRLGVLARNRSLILAVIPELFSDAELREAYFRQVVMPTLTWLFPLIRRALDRQGIKQFNPRVVLPAFMGGVVGAFLANEYEGFPFGEPIPREQLARQLSALYLRGFVEAAGAPPPSATAD